MSLCDHADDGPCTGGHGAFTPEGTEPYKDKETLERLYHGNGLSLKQTAECLGCSDVTVLRYLRKFGIRTRTLSEANRINHATFRTDNGGYERWSDSVAGIRVHQLLAIAEGVDPHKVFSGGEFHVHHRNGIPWDNRPDNIEVLDESGHHKLHSNSRDLDGGRSGGAGHD